MNKITNFLNIDTFPFSREHSLMIDFIIEKNIFQKKKGSKILEIGGYYGRDALELARFGEVTIIDESDDTKFQQFLNEAKSVLENGYSLTFNNNIWKLNKNKIEYINQDIKSYEFKNKEYDVICSYNVLHRFDVVELKALINKSYGILKPNGIMVHIFVSDIDCIRKGYENELNRENNDIKKHKKIDILNSFNGLTETMDSLEYRHILEYDNVRLVHPHVMWYLFFKKNL